MDRAAIRLVTKLLAKAESTDSDEESVALALRSYCLLAGTINAHEESRDTATRRRERRLLQDRRVAGRSGETADRAAAAASDTTAARAAAPVGDPGRHGGGGRPGDRETVRPAGQPSVAARRGVPGSSYLHFLSSTAPPHRLDCAL
jgi:hypothetical protein